MSTSISAAYPSRAWIADQWPIEDASPELEEAARLYLDALVAPHGGEEANRPWREARDLIFRLVGYSHAYFVGSDVLIRVVFDLNGAPRHPQITARWQPIRRPDLTRRS